MENEDGTQRFERAKKNMKVVILAGRYFASLCEVDANREQFGFDDGFEDARAMQAGLDRKYPSKYNLLVYKYENGHVKLMFGNPSYACRNIQILWHKEESQVKNKNCTDAKFFGLSKRFNGHIPTTRRISRQEVERLNLENALKKDWTFKVNRPDGVLDFAIPDPYYGKNLYRPFYKEIKRPEFDSDLHRNIPEDCDDLQDIIVRTSVNLDQFGIIKFNVL